VGSAEQSFLDFRDRNPFDFYLEHLTQEDTGYWDERMNAWVIFDRKGCSEVQRNEAVFAHPYNGFPGGVKVQGGARQVIMLHGPDHVKVHNFLARQFSPEICKRYREQFITPLVSRTLDGLKASKSGDLNRLFVDHLPAYVICALLGLPIDDEALLARCKKWNDDIMRWNETFGEDPQILATALDSADRLAEVMMPIILDRKQNPQEDFISALWREGDNLLTGWNELDVLAQTRVLLFAGSETTAHLIGNCIFQLLEDHELQRDLALHPERVEVFVEEVLRFHGVVHFRVRQAAKDVEQSGCPIKSGDRVHPVLAAANRDPRHYADPGAFDMDRPRARDHLAFGLGQRLCVGANLARAEAAEVVRQILVLLPNLRWEEGGEETAHLTGHMNRSYRPLKVLWD
jgi:cytochrome P450